MDAEVNAQTDKRPDEDQRHDADGSEGHEPRCHRERETKDRRDQHDDWRDDAAKKDSKNQQHNNDGSRSGSPYIILQRRGRLDRRNERKTEL